MNHILSFELDNGGFTELELFQIAEHSEWKSRKELSIGENIKNYTFVDIPLVNNEMDTNKLIGTVHAIIGIVINKTPNQSCKYYYMIMVPNQDFKFNVYLVQHSWKYTTTLYNKCNMSGVISNLIGDPIKWKIPHDFICSIMVANDDNWFAFYAACGIFTVVGTKDLKTNNKIVLEYNNLTLGVHNRQNVTKRQIQRQIRHENKKQKVKHTLSYSDSVAVMLPEAVAKKFLVGKDIYDKTFDAHGSYGIRSKDLGGRTKILPILSHLPVTHNPPISQSEMHVVTSLPEAFRTEHSFSTLASAINSLKSECPPDEMIKIVGAVSSKFFEDISWRLVPEIDVPQRIKSLKIDIDQVKLLFITDLCFASKTIITTQTTLHVKSFKLLQFDETNIMDYLDLMYHNLVIKVSVKCSLSAVFNVRIFYWFVGDKE